MSIRPYIGITDFTSFEQVLEMLEIFRRHRPSGSKRVLHAGVMMSYKTLNGIETKWSGTFPAKETISDIFRPNGDDVYYCLHYADYHNDSESSDLAGGLKFAGPYVNAIQLDMTWPDPRMIARGIRMSHRQVEVILQVGKTAMEIADNDPREVLRRLESYEGVIDRVLLDKSVGRGIGMNASSLIPFARAVRDRFPNMGIVVAGGLGPDSVGLVGPLVREFPDISIDAQGKLRPSGSAFDPVDWNMAGRYLVEALKLVK